MRTAKLSLMFSASVLLLAVSWFLVTGQIGEVTPARAQVGGDVIGFSWHDPSGTEPNEFFLVVTADGSVYRADAVKSGEIPAAIVGSEYIGNALTGAVPAGSSSMSDIKRRYGSDQ